MNDQAHPAVDQPGRRIVMKFILRCFYVLVVLAVASTGVAVPAFAGTRPVVSGLSKHRGAYWGGTPVTVYGSNFSGVRNVFFGKVAGWDVEVLSSSRLTVVVPAHGFRTVD